MIPKKIAADKAVSFIKNGMVVGLGTGTTAYWAIQKIGQRIKDEGLQLQTIATSVQSEALARELHIPVSSFKEISSIDITIDGADEATTDLDLIKGGGGALLREKIVASATKRLIIIADESKLVSQLGTFPLPVEINIFGWELVCKKLKALHCLPKLRMNGDDRFITDNGNYILDCAFGSIPHPAALHAAINAITGVVDNGLFVQMAQQLIIGYHSGKVETFESKRLPFFGL